MEKEEYERESRRVREEIVLREDEIEVLDRPYNQVLIPLDSIPHPRDNVVMVAFDIEDYGIQKEKLITTKAKSYMFQYNERVPLAITCAFYDKEGKIITMQNDMKRKWSFKRLVQWIVNGLRKQKIEIPKTLYLLTHFSIAEFRHLKDWDRIEQKAKKTFIQAGKSDYMHYQDWVEAIVDEWGYPKKIKVNVVDTFAFFLAGLKKIAESIGEKKLDLSWNEKDHQYWIEHMRELKEKNPDLFWRYAKNDSIVLLKAFTKFRSFFIDVEMEGEPLNLEILTRRTPTVASIASIIFRHRFLRHDTAPCRKVTFLFKEDRYQQTADKEGFYYKKERKVTKTIFDSKKEREWKNGLQIRYHAMRSYWGGRREAFGRGVKKGDFVVLDFKGHYNRCGQTQPLPNADTKWEWYFWTKDWNRIKELEGFVECDFEFPEDFKYPCLPVKDEKSERLMFPRKSEHAFFTIFELRIALEICPKLWFVIHKAVGFKPTLNENNHDLKAFLEFWEKRKDKAEEKEGRKSLNRDIAKLMGNSIVGKFMQRVDPFGFEDMLTIFESLGYERERTSQVLRTMRRKKEEKKQKVGSTWCPEWGALILGRARGLLGLAFHIAQPLTGHTDSMFLENDPKRIAEIHQVLGNYGSRLAVEETFDKIWILRSAVYVLWKDGKAIKAVRHGYPCSEKFFGELITENLEAEKVVRNKVYKMSIIKPKAGFRRNLPIGADYERETEIKWKWDYKRKLIVDKKQLDKLDKLLWTTWIDTDPYYEVKDAWKEEMDYHKRERQRKLKKKGRKKRKKSRKGPRPKVEKEVIRRYEAGESVTSIAKSFRKHPNTIWNVIRRHKEKKLTDFQFAELLLEEYPFLIAQYFEP